MMDNLFHSANCRPSYGGTDMVLICIGDSLTAGFGVRLSQRWSSLAASASGWQIINHGINGDTTGGMLARLNGCLAAHPNTRGAQRPQVLIMGGSNDIFFSGTDQYARANIGAIAHQLISTGITPMIGLPIPVLPQFAPAHWAQVVDFQTAATRLEEYVDWLTRFSNGFGFSCVDFHSDFLRADGTPRTELYLDGLHPTAEGHQKMAERLLRHLGVYHALSEGVSL